MVMSFRAKTKFCLVTYKDVSAAACPLLVHPSPQGIHPWGKAEFVWLCKRYVENGFKTPGFNSKMKCLNHSFSPMSVIRHLKNSL